MQAQVNFEEQQDKHVKRGVIRRGIILPTIVFAFLVGLVVLLVYVRVNSVLYWGATEWVLEREIREGKRLDFARLVLGTKHEYGAAAFMEFVEKSDVEAVYHYLACGADANTQIDGKGSALCVAVNNGNMQIVQLLLGSGARGEPSEVSNCAPLEAAVQKQHALMVELLLNRGINPNAASKGGRIALDVAVETENVALSSLLLKMGSNVNHIDDIRQTPLHLAVRTGNISLIEMLLEAGANVNKVDGEGKTALEYASRANRFDLVDLFRKYGAVNGALKSEGQSAILTGKNLSDKNTSTGVNTNPVATNKDDVSKSANVVEANKDKGSVSEVITEDMIKDELARGQGTPDGQADSESKLAEQKKEKDLPLQNIHTSKSKNPQLTQVRALGSPIGTWQHKGKITLTSVSVRAKNLTTAVAHDVVVEVVLPDNSKVTLEGPSELNANETGVYELQLSKNVYSNRRLRAEVTCDNCH